MPLQTPAASPCAPTCGCGVSRRGFFAGATAVAAMAATPSLGQPASPTRGIDVHHHFTSPPQLAAKVGLPPIDLDWTPARSIERLDRAGVRTAILSITNPGVWAGQAEPARKLVTEINDYAATVVADHKGRFGMYVTLSLPDIDGALKEIEYGLDTLKADGVAMYTSYGDMWMGHPHFAPLMEELNRRGAVAFVHPTDPACCSAVAGLNNRTIEYGTETTRTIASFVLNGGALRYPKIRFIFCHAGGTMPFLVDRFEFEARNPAIKAKLPGGDIHAALAQFYYDTAQASNHTAMSALTDIVPKSHILFGSDYPFRSVEEHVKNLPAAKVFSPTEIEAIMQTTPGMLFPRFAV